MQNHNVVIMREKAVRIEDVMGREGLNDDWVDKLNADSHVDILEKMMKHGIRPDRVVQCYSQ